MPAVLFQPLCNLLPLRPALGLSICSRTGWPRALTALPRSRCWLQPASGASTPRANSWSIRAGGSRSGGPSPFGAANGALLAGLQRRSAVPWTPSPMRKTDRPRDATPPGTDYRSVGQPFSQSVGRSVGRLSDGRSVGHSMDGLPLTVCYVGHSRMHTGAPRLSRPTTKTAGHRRPAGTRHQNGPCCTSCRGGACLANCHKDPASPVPKFDRA
jgi:hypothetical protein